MPVDALPDDEADGTESKLPESFGARRGGRWRWGKRWAESTISGGAGSREGRREGKETRVQRGRSDRPGKSEGWVKVMRKGNKGDEERERGRGGKKWGDASRRQANV